VIKQITFFAVHNVGGLDLKKGWKENAESSCKWSSDFSEPHSIVDLKLLGIRNGNLPVVGEGCDCRDINSYRMFRASFGRWSRKKKQSIRLSRLGDSSNLIGRPILHSRYHYHPDKNYTMNTDTYNGIWKENRRLKKFPWAHTRWNCHGRPNRRTR
jgi:hypothetical protein